MARVLIFDATPLIYVIRVSLAGYLEKLSNPKILPQSVLEELVEQKPFPRPESHVIRELVARGILKPEIAADPEFARRVVKLADDSENTPLHKAEAEALALANQLGGIVISDDRAARTVARLVGVELHGTGYLLGRMFVEGHLPIERAIMKLQEMRRSGWRVSEEDIQSIPEYLSNV